MLGCDNFVSQLLVWLPTAVIDANCLHVRATTSEECLDFVFDFPENLVDILLVKDNDLLVVSTSVASIVKVQEDFLHKLVTQAF